MYSCSRQVVRQKERQLESFNRCRTFESMSNFCQILTYLEPFFLHIQAVHFYHFFCQNYLALLLRQKCDTKASVLTASLCFFCMCHNLVHLTKQKKNRE